MGDLDLTHMTLAEALAFAALIERDARDRYLTLARSMQEYGETEVGRFFRRMALLEEEHRVALEQRRAGSLGALGPGGLTLAHALEGPLTDEVAMGLTLRGALELALAAEERAHQFFVAAQPFLDDEEIRRLFSELASEEVEHQALIRNELASLATL